MKKIASLILTLCVVALMVLTAGAVQATIITFTWDFATGPSNDTGVSSKDYFDTTSGTAVPITASGFNTTNSAPTDGSNWVLAGVTPHNLFEKSEGLGETGLGLTGTSLGANEIQDMTLIQLDLTNIFNQVPPFTNLMIGIGSIQTPEKFEIFGSNSTAADAASGVLLLPQGVFTGTSIQTFTLFSGGDVGNNFIWVTGNVDDILLLNGVVAQRAVPEPACLLLLGFGLVGLAGIRRKFKK